VKLWLGIFVMKFGQAAPTPPLATANLQSTMFSAMTFSAMKFPAMKFPAMKFLFGAHSG
jgi:hypothetical protein